MRKRRRWRNDAERLEWRRRRNAARNRRLRRAKRAAKRHAQRHALVADYDALIAAIAHRRKALGLSQLAMDERSGLPDGYQGKLEAKVRNLGPMSLGLVLQALGLRIALIPEGKRIIGRRTR